MAHYHYGVTQWRSSRPEEAERAFRVALGMAPELNRARLRLARLLEERGENAEAAALRQAAKTFATGEIVVVSGLPRSGTSMMMQMLVAGGLEPFSDHARPPDEHNPYGYYEHRAVARLHSDQAWLPLAIGKAVKIVAPLLPALPPRYRYKIIFMERPIDQVLASQDAMLGQATEVPSLGLLNAVINSLEEAKAWTARLPHSEILFLSYPEVLADPGAAAQRIAAFLGHALEVEKMVAAVRK
jgi:hypothetical protein